MKKWLWVTGIIVVLVLVIVMVIAGYWFQWSWTGFPAKTLWDWLNLLGVLAIPVVVGFGAVWYTTRQTQASEMVSEQQHQFELAIAVDNQREAALQAYVGKMSELLLEKNLCQSAQGNEVRMVARVLTLTVLPRLDGKRKRNVLQFLYESQLIDKDDPIVHLDGADLSEASLGRANLIRVNLSGVNLYKVDLSEANLKEANLNDTMLNKSLLWRAELNGANLSGSMLGLTNLKEADLSGAKLSSSKLLCTNLSQAILRAANLRKALLLEADLSKANLSEADLEEANLSSSKGVTDEQLSQAKSLKGAILPDGSTHP